MRNNGKTSAIDCRGYRSSFDLILFPLVRFLAPHDCTWFIWVGGLQKSGGGDEGEPTTVVALEW
jgi:hypothetical protein